MESTVRPRGAALAATLFCTALAAASSTPADAKIAAIPDGRPSAVLVATDAGVVRGASAPGGYVFRGLPYAAPPTGALRWHAPRPVAAWRGVRDATEFAPSCPQPEPPQNPFRPPGVLDEDCLYLNVSTLALHRRPAARLPVLVWIHGGGLTQDASRNYDGTKLASTGAVVVTINYRLGALGFLAHPALSQRPGGPTGNYGLMDQQAALRWVQRNIRGFGGDPRNVTIAGQSAGGLSVLAHLVSPGSRGLFQRAVVQSGAFALTQQPLIAAEAAGKAFADAVGCPDQTADCLRHRPVADLVNRFPGAAIPGVIDGKVLRESIGTSLVAGRFARVPILNGIVHDEERLFVAIGVTVSGGSFVPLPERPTPANYEQLIAAVLGVSPGRAAMIAAEYPLTAYPSPDAAFSTLASDANFACPALQVDRWTARRVPTFAYQFDDDAAPQQTAPPGAVAPVATHGSELQYLFDLPNVPFPGALDAAQRQLAAGMRAAWASFAASGDPDSPHILWPPFAGQRRERVLSLVTPQPRIATGFSAAHHCAFWDEGPARRQAVP